MCRRVICAVLATSFVGAASQPRLLGRGQSEHNPPAFEVASVKANQSRTCDRDGSFAGGRFVMTCSTLHELMIVAFPRADERARFDSEFAGGPSWINADHFDVIAKVPEGQGIGIDSGHTAVATAAEAAGINRMRTMLDPSGVSVFTALREQLGLKLESTKAPIDVLVIDHVEHPTPNSESTLASCPGPALHGFENPSTY